LIWGNWLSAVAAVVLVLIALVHRPRIEERALTATSAAVTESSQQAAPGLSPTSGDAGYSVRCFLVEEAHSRGKSALISEEVPGADR
jgi:hypothetical protein